VDWWRFDQTRSKIRVAVKRVLREWGYPPDLQDAAIKLVVMQAEALAAEVIARRSAEIGAVA
jgi:type I restriction enzyme R subunit